MKAARPSRAYVALGANLGQPVISLQSAFDSLSRLDKTSLLNRSSIYRTAPIGVSDGQPDYYNAVVALDTALSPQELLAALLKTETDHGRVRPAQLAARTLDLDLLMYDERVIDETGLTVPHPRMHLRAFVLHPLHEIAPGLVIPGRGPVADLLRSVSDQRIAKIEA